MLELLKYVLALLPVLIFACYQIGNDMADGHDDMSVAQKMVAGFLGLIALLAFVAACLAFIGLTIWGINGLFRYFGG